MPLFWRYLLKNYFQVFLLSVLGFIGILLLTRIQEIARLASLSADIGHVVQFILLQIPYILSFAIPMSGFISAMLLLQRLSCAYELTAFRTSGIGMRALTTPLTMAAVFLSVIHLIVVTEITPRSRDYSHNLIENLALTNPFFLMKQLKSQKFYIDMEIVTSGKEGKDMIFAVKNRSNNRLTLFLAKKFLLNDSLIEAKKVALISHSEGAKDGYDDLIIENQQEISTSIDSFAPLFQKNSDRIRLEYFPTQVLLHRPFPKSDEKWAKRRQSEIYRRFLFPLNTFALTVLGFSLGMETQRERKMWKIYAAFLFSSFTFFSSIAAKSLHLSPHKALFFYILPFPILLFASHWTQKQLARG